MSDKSTHTVNVVEKVTRQDGTSLNLWTKVGAAKAHRDGKGMNVWIGGKEYVIRENRVFNAVD